MAAFLRFHGLGFGLPAVFHPDEPVLVHEALKLGVHRLNTDYVNHPHLFIYLLYFLYGAVFLLGKTVGIFSSLGKFQELFFSDPTLFYLLGRGIVALTGVGTVWVLYLLGRRSYGRRVGLCAALFLSVAFLHVRESHYIKLGILETFWVTLGSFFLIDMIQSRRLRSYLLAGLAAGAALSTNYNCILFWPAIAVAHWIRTHSEKTSFWLDRKLWLSYGAAVFGFAATSPVLLLKFGAFVSKDFYLFQTIGRGQETAVEEGMVPWVFYLTRTLRFGLGIPLLALSILGVGYAVTRRRREDLCLLFFPTLYLGACLLMIGVSVHRYILPIVPVVLLWAARLWEEGLTRFRQTPKRRLGYAFGLACFLSVPLASSLYHNYLISSGLDTRLQAKRWVESRLPTGTKIAIERFVAVPAFGPPLKETAEENKAKLEMIRQRHPEKGRYRSGELEILVRHPPTYVIIDLGGGTFGGTYENDYHLNDLIREGVRYVIVNDLFTRPFLNSKRRNERVLEFRRMLERHAEVACVFDPFRLGANRFFLDHDAVVTPFDHLFRLRYPGPRLTVYELRPNPLIEASR